MLITTDATIGPIRNIAFNICIYGDGIGKFLTMTPTNATINITYRAITYFLSNFFLVNCIVIYRNIDNIKMTKNILVKLKTLSLPHFVAIIPIPLDPLNLFGTLGNRILREVLDIYIYYIYIYIYFSILLYI